MRKTIIALVLSMGWLVSAIAAGEIGAESEKIMMGIKAGCVQRGNPAGYNWTPVVQSKFCTCVGAMYYQRVVMVSGISSMNADTPAMRKQRQEIAQRCVAFAEDRITADDVTR